MKGMTNFKILSGLPVYGEMPKQFSATGMGMHSEGVVVEFFPLENNSSWIGNFQRGLTSLDQVIQHPDNSSVIVIAGGECYIVDVENQKLKDNFGGAFETLINIPDKQIVIFGTSVDFVGVDASGIRWESQRISWDGIRSLKLKDEKLFGEAWALDDVWVSFSIDVNTGEHEGGAKI